MNYETFDCLDRLRLLSPEIIQDVMDSCDSLGELWPKLGLGGYSTAVYKKIILEKGLDYEPLRRRGLSKRVMPARDSSGRVLRGPNRTVLAHIQDNQHLIFSENSIYDGTKVRRLVRTHNKRFNWLPEVCAECGLGPEWNGKPLALQLDHKNGLDRDNRLGINLRYVCPNCHTQTENYASKNRGKKGEEFYQRRASGNNRILGPKVEFENTYSRVRTLKDLRY